MPIREIKKFEQDITVSNLFRILEVIDILLIIKATISIILLKSLLLVHEKRIKVSAVFKIIKTEI